MADHRPTMQEQLENAKKAMEEEVVELDKKLNRIRVLYDQYFMGVERLPPEMMRNELDKAFMRSKIPRSRSTALKFRFRSVRQKYTSLKSYWDRIVRLIEEGRIRRGITGRAESSGMSGGIRSESSGAGAGAAPESASRPASLREEGMERRKALKQKKFERQKRMIFDPAEVDDIYAALVRQKRLAGDDPGRMTRKAIETNIQKILARAGDQDIRLKVVNREGKVTLVAVKPQKDP
ncbi:MAG: hypothetical protein ABIK09_00965 [Pseudomonadota bacterium]